MAYVKIKDRNLKMLTISFISKDINITKQVREDRVGKFRQDILYLNNLQGTKYPHLIKTLYKENL